ncbi:MAG: tRNA preQ1(34) S-adenosylmethionine ribosyltransferase-isomerase QueA [Planctomycetaceae bacterium]|nr:tRNA preQ1(34) S-adenosylmethionine ribosyltransferase-isomerase QueA [Planctomycetaceae bacterium]
MSDKVSFYDYDLPSELIATHPPPNRDDARLMVVDRAAGTVRHRMIRELPALLRSGDCLVLNDTKVLPARLLGHRLRTGGRWEGLFLETTPAGHWKLLGQTRGKLQPREQIVIAPAHDRQSTDELRLELVERDDGGIWTARVLADIDPLEALDHFGTIPLPPYMHRELAEADDFNRYQTAFARNPGSVAAPTAGLHFTPELLAACQARAVDHAFVTLHVGIGTFRPITAERLADHQMHSEWCDVSAATVQRLHSVRRDQGRVIAVGTTSTRTLESHAKFGAGTSWRGTTDLFIRPPYEFQAIDGLLTNYHLPRSTLLVLVSTFAGCELIQAAYAEAIRERYRFYSYGDAMLIV